MAYLASANTKHNIVHMAEFSVSEYLTTYKFFIELGKMFLQIAKNVFKLNLGIFNVDLTFELLILKKYGINAPPSPAKIKLSPHIDFPPHVI